MTLDQALAPVVEAAKRLEQSVAGVKEGLRLELATLTTSIVTEQRINNDERKELHLRIDRLEQTAHERHRELMKALASMGASVG